MRLRTVLLTDTIPCLLSPWSDWSDCSVTCGKGLRTRQRKLKSPVELGDCTEELEQVEKCMLPECRKYTTLCAHLRTVSVCACTELMMCTAGIRWQMSVFNPCFYLWLIQTMGTCHILPAQPSTASCQSGQSGQSATSLVGRVTPSEHAWWWWSHSLGGTPAQRAFRGRSVRSGSVAEDRATGMTRNDAKNRETRGGANWTELRSRLNIQVRTNVMSFVQVWEGLNNSPV